MVLESHRRSEHRHDAVAGELVDRGAIALDQPHGAIDQFGHNLAESFRTNRGRNAHGLHHVCEKHRDLFVLRARIALGHRRATAMTEPGVLEGLSATGSARRHGRHPTLPTPETPEFIQIGR